MLVVVAGQDDGEARELAGRWAPWDAAVLTCEDLSTAGWRYFPDDPEGSAAMIAGRSVAAGEITGVLTRLMHVSEPELRRIAREDRAYAAAEMTAFLRSWLSGLRCPVLNRPTSTCLSAPGWRREQTAYVAAQLGIPVQPVTWRLEPGSGVVEEQPSPPDVTVAVVGARCLGSAADGALAAQARRLAWAAGVDLLAVRFSETETGFELHGVDPWADVSSPEIADAILEHFLPASEQEASFPTPKRGRPDRLSLPPGSRERSGHEG